MYSDVLGLKKKWFTSVCLKEKGMGQRKRCYSKKVEQILRKEKHHQIKKISIKSSPLKLNISARYYSLFYTENKKNLQPDNFWFKNPAVSNFSFFQIK